MVPPPPPWLREVDEAELVRRFREGGRAGAEAYSELVQRQQAWVIRLVAYLLGSFADAEDVAQEAFVRGFTHRDSFQKGDHFRAWIRTIATRVAFNHRREANTRKRYHDAAMGADDSAPNEASEVRDLLEHVLAELPYAYREILVLKYVEELPLSVIGEMLNLGESAAKMRLMRAREDFFRLQKEMSDGRR